MVPGAHGEAEEGVVHLHQGRRAIVHREPPAANQADARSDQPPGRGVDSEREAVRNHPGDGDRALLRRRALDRPLRHPHGGEVVEVHHPQHHRHVAAHPFGARRQEEERQRLRVAPDPSALEIGLGHPRWRQVAAMPGEQEPHSQEVEESLRKLPSQERESTPVVAAVQLAADEQSGLGRPHRVVAARVPEAVERRQIRHQVVALGEDAEGRRGASALRHEVGDRRRRLQVEAQRYRRLIADAQEGEVEGEAGDGDARKPGAQAGGEEGEQHQTDAAQGRQPPGSLPDGIRRRERQEAGGGRRQGDGGGAPAAAGLPQALQLEAGGQGHGEDEEQPQPGVGAVREARQRLDRGVERRDAERGQEGGDPAGESGDPGDPAATPGTGGTGDRHPRERQGQGRQPGVGAAQLVEILRPLPVPVARAAEDQGIDERQEETALEGRRCDACGVGVDRRHPLACRQLLQEGQEGRGGETGGERRGAQPPDEEPDASRPEDEEAGDQGRGGEGAKGQGLGMAGESEPAGAGG